MQHIVAEKERQLQEKDEKHGGQLQAKDDQLQAKDEKLQEKDDQHARQLQEKDEELQRAADREKFGEDSSAGGGDTDAYDTDPGAAAR